jgi:hypothetical protein
MWQPHQFLRHMVEPQLKVSAFIYILITTTRRDLSVQSLDNAQGDDVHGMKQIAKDKSIGRKWLSRIANRVDRCKHINALKVVIY